MKFLNLATGYTFDGLWHNWMPWSDWDVHNIDASKIDTYYDTDSTEYLFSNNYDDDDPIINPSNWSTSLEIDDVKRYAIRTREAQIKGYIFWFPKEQSIDLVYTMPIAIVTDNDTPLTLSIEDNDIFSFISHAAEEVVVDGYKFAGEPVYSTSIVTTPEQVNSKYVHVFNVACSSKAVGEYVCKIVIGDAGYIRVGADFYGEYEPAYINLSNMGVEIPTGVQKAIYDSNVHEDKTDNILINRKFKELLSNYWDVVANRGSYKSLVNSLEWFEWDNLLQVKEILKHGEASRTIFSDEDMLSVLDTKIGDSFTNFAKTTYISLYCSLQNELPSYDNELNPVLEQAALKWTRNDIQLKIALLAQFFGIYFMPMHMSILHAVAEDAVFSSTIKAIHGAEVKRDDCFGDTNYVECNIKDDAVFKMSNVNAQVSNHTTYGIKYPDTAVFGVDIFPTDGAITESDICTFSSKYYGGPGAIIPIKLVLPNQTVGDFLKTTLVDYTTEDGSINRVVLSDVINEADGKITINFNFLAKAAQEYTIKFTFILGSSKSLTRTVKFTVEDADNLNINVYKVRAKDDTNGLTRSDFSDNRCGKYVFRIQNGEVGKQYYTQYLPYMLPSDERYDDYHGIKLSRTVIFDLRNKNGLGHMHTDHEILFLKSVMQRDFIDFAKYDYTNPDNPVMTYLIFVSKRFYAEVPEAVYENVYEYTYNIIRNELGFYPQFHYLEKMDGTNIDNYTVSPYEAVCCAVEINTGDGPKEFRYGHMIDTAEWSYYNHLTGETVCHPESSQKPFVVNEQAMHMKPGYYDISFKYSLTNGATHECRLDSAFRIK